jgi:radical SAM superfamily enzyme YgiQ (UPF0313 family)
MASQKLKVKLILPALTEAHGKYWRSIKYSLFPPLGLASLAGYLNETDEIEIVDEHIEKLDINDEPDIVALQVYITSAKRAYQIADAYRRKNVFVALGGLHATAIPEEANLHCDSIFLGPAEYSWPKFIEDFRNKRPLKTYYSTQRDLLGAPAPRRDLLKLSRYLVPNSLVVSRGCPYDCDFCYKHSFFQGGKSFYVQRIEKTLQEISRFEGKHVFFLDDNIFGDKPYALALFDALKGMDKVWQAAGTVKALMDDELLNQAAAAGLKSLFIGFETLNHENLHLHNKRHNNAFHYERAIRRLHDRGVMINGSFIFGMDSDTQDSIKKTTDWAIQNSVETATFHILTPYPGSTLYDKLAQEKRILTHDWDLYDTRHCVFRPLKMTPEQLENGYWSAYRQFYQWSSIVHSALNKDKLKDKLRHFAYTAGWKKCEPFWSLMIRTHRVHWMIPLLEKLLDI